MRYENLLNDPGNSYLTALYRVERALEKALPIPSAHKRSLPRSVQELSYLLTQERGTVSQSYWAAPGFVAAYTYYFLPWNLQRLAWLLPGLPLNLQPNSRILDLGSGPLTLVLGLWCSRPDLRDTPLTFTCADIAGRPLEIGKSIFQALAGPDTPWIIHLLKAPLESALSKVRHPQDLIMAGNVFNEVKAPRHGTLSTRLEELMQRMRRSLAPEGRMLLIEPGTRLGGKTISLMRQNALKHGCSVLSPCPHQRPCPALEQEFYSPTTPAYKGWCHFICPAKHQSPRLESLALRAGLTKETLALSCLLLQNGADQQDPWADLEQEYMDLDSLDVTEEKVEQPKPSIPSGNHEQPPSAPHPEAAFPARIISNSFSLAQGAARYACSEFGLCLVLDGTRIHSGTLIQVRLAEKQAARDNKSGALLVRAVSAPAPVPHLHKEDSLHTKPACQPGEHRTKTIPRGKEAHSRGQHQKKKTISKASTSSSHPGEKHNSRSTKATTKPHAIRRKPNQ